MTDNQRFIHLIPQHRKINIHPDDKHKKHQPYLAQQLQIHQRILRKQTTEKVRKKQPQHRRPQHNPRHNLTNHPRLTDKPEHPGKQPDRKQYHNNLKQQNRKRTPEIIQNNTLKHPESPLPELPRHSMRRKPLPRLQGHINQPPENKEHQHINTVIFLIPFHKYISPIIF